MNLQAIERVDMDSAKWGAFRHVHNMGLEDIGRFMGDFSARCLMGDVDWVCSFTFVRRVFMEKPPRLGRIKIHDHIRANVLAVGKCGYCGATEDLSVDH